MTFRSFRIVVRDYTIEVLLAECALIAIASGTEDFDPSIAEIGQLDTLGACAIGTIAIFMGAVFTNPALAEIAIACALFRACTISAGICSYGHEANVSDREDIY